MGSTYEGRSLLAMRMHTRSGLPKVWMSCGQHAREWIAPAACMYVMDLITKVVPLVERAVNSSRQRGDGPRDLAALLAEEAPMLDGRERSIYVRIARMMDRHEVVIAPILNPDGYEYSRTPGGLFWRKNRRRNHDGTIGVDLNRNWTAFWGHPSMRRRVPSFGLHLSRGAAERASKLTHLPRRRRLDHLRDVRRPLCWK